MCGFVIRLQLPSLHGDFNGWSVVCVLGLLVDEVLCSRDAKPPKSTQWRADFTAPPPAALLAASCDHLFRFIYSVSAQSC